MLPELKPGAMRQHFIMPAIRSRDIGCAAWSAVRCFEHFLQLLDVINDAFNVHGSQSSSRKQNSVNQNRR